MNRLFFFLLSIFITQSVLADYITNNINGGCNNNVLSIFDDTSVLLPVFNVNTYNCNNGYYLPADALGCASCLYGYDCPGGTYAYNPDINQGISYKRNISENVYHGCVNDLLYSEDHYANLTPVFIPNEYVCNSGYYLPADAIACAVCPVGNKCVGGTYTFNENTSSGIESCNGSFAPAGSAVCYDHLLHVGNESIYLSATKRTTPSLNVAYGNDVFYANMTTTQTVMTAGSSHYFKTIYNNQVYYICDNTSCPQ